jgi:GrpB-like predicted nucleotidyltransferase (UPF0157 family)
LPGRGKPDLAGSHRQAASGKEELRKHSVGEPVTAAGRIELCDYDPSWPQLYDREAARIRSILRERAVRLDHAGSTSVPGLAAKPIIDLVLEVPDAADRALYVRTKRELAARPWTSVQQYADAKTAVIGEILARAVA